MANSVIFLRHILESIRLIEEYLEEADLDVFLASTRLQDAVFRRLEVIGEAAKNVRPVHAMRIQRFRGNEWPASVMC